VSASLAAALAARLAAVDAAGRRRVLRPLAPDGPVYARDASGRRVLVFSSNDTLGLAQHPAVRAAWATGAGAGSARLIAGDRPAHHALEAALAERFGRRVTLFSSGWHANLAVLTTLLQPGELAASDALNHASLIDGLRLAGARKAVLPHGSAAIPAGARVAVTEGLFSMDGDIPDLRAWAAGAAAVDAWTVVDEAHAVGVLGPDGRGAAAACGVEPDVVVGTLGKALGSHGAFVVGPDDLHALLVSAGRTFLFTTGLPEGAAAAAAVALGLATDALRVQVAENAARLRAGLRARGFPSAGVGPIVPLVLGPRAMAVADALWEAGFAVPGIRPPTVAPGTERLRFSVSAAHTAAQVDALLAALDRALETR
jgi:8-amino-7-oxononanoate synthase